MADRKRLLLLGSSVGALALLVGLLSLAGVDRVLTAVLSADRPLVALVFLLGFGWLLAWSAMLRTVLATLDVSLSPARAFLIYSGAVFAHNVTPFGQAGGEPVAAMIIAKASDSRYETGLAGIASVDLLNVVPSLALIVAGISYTATTQGVGSRVEVAAVSAMAIVSGTALALALVWTGRRSVIDRLPGMVARVVDWLGVGAADSLETGLTDRLEHLVEDLERVAAMRWRLGVALGFSLTGWLLQAAAMTAAFAAVGHSVSPHVFLFVIPLSYVAGAAPLPGGLGGIEAALVALLVPTTGVAVSAITAAVLLFRGAIYWMPIAIGSVVVWAYGVRSIW